MSAIPLRVTIPAVVVVVVVKTPSRVVGIIQPKRFIDTTLEEQRAYYGDRDNGSSEHDLK